MRFGLGMNSDHALEEVGQQFSVTRERILADRGRGDAKAQPSDPVEGAASGASSKRLNCRATP